MKRAASGAARRIGKNLPLVRLGVNIPPRCVEYVSSKTHNLDGLARAETASSHGANDHAGPSLTVGLLPRAENTSKSPSGRINPFLAPASWSLRPVAGWHRRIRAFGRPRQWVDFRVCKRTDSGLSAG